MSKWSKKFEQLKFTYLGIEYTTDVAVFMYRDSNYGADADGHRGISMDFIDDIKIEKVRDLIGEDVSEEVWEKMEEGIIEAVYKEELDDGTPTF